MSRVQRARAQPVHPFEWVGSGAQTSFGDARPPALMASTLVDDSPPTSGPGWDQRSRPDPAPHPIPDFAALERDAFTQGFAQGERAGNEAAATRVDALLRRLALTIDELAVLRSDILHKSERQLVQLALAVARRITLRELTIDRALLLAMARAALDRLGETSSATIRLHPDDYRAIAAPGEPEAAPGSVRVVADATIAPGGCVVQSDVGLIDVGLDAQLAEIAAVLAGDDATGVEEAIVVAA
jgi:flagellar assembly protein FliH